MYWARLGWMAVQGTLFVRAAAALGLRDRQWMSAGAEESTAQTRR